MSKYYIGKYKNIDGVKFFIFKEDKYLKNKETLYIQDYIVFEGDGTDANKAFKEYVDRQKGNAGSRLIVGDVGYYQDSDGGHHALILGIENDYLQMLFLTSSDRWSNKARLITDEERHLLGRPSIEYDNYFAPVTRINLFFKPLGFSFPEYRVKELIEEFYGH